LTAGGEHSPENTKAQIYCPPYLFNAGGSQAARPEIMSAPSNITYGESFVIAMPGPTTISSACLIRPGAVTHGYNQDQRYIPLTFAPSSPTHLRATAPTSGRVAPPGDYLLFILNQSGVPSVASWVRLGQCPTIPCDTDSPPPVTTLYPDIVGPGEVWLVWYAPATTPARSRGNTICATPDRSQATMTTSEPHRPRGSRRSSPRARR
jgi:hypothetical protein